MERKNIINNPNREVFIKFAYADKKGRDIASPNPFTMYINIGSSYPDLPFLTASLLQELAKNPDDSKTWASRWDKSIIAVAANSTNYCDFLPNYDSKGKSYIPVKTKGIIDSSVLLSTMPKSNGPFIGINNMQTTTDGFLISYFHMVNELLWDKAIEKGNGSVDTESYLASLNEVMVEGFSVGLLSEDEMIKAKILNPGTSMRIYGSRVNPFVPEIMGVILTK